MKTLIFLLAATIFCSPTPKDHTYSVWSGESKLHLIISDNGTPGDYDDDWIVDWENNRDYEITILD